MPVQFLVDVFSEYPERPALIWHDQILLYKDLLNLMRVGRDILRQATLQPGSVVALEADFSPQAVAMLLVLIQHRCTIVPLTSATATHRNEFLQMACVSHIIRIDPQTDYWQHKALAVSPTLHPLLKKLQDDALPGLVLFSSGSTGKSKGIVHNFIPLLEKFWVKRTAKRMITFLLFDHIGGINTLLYILSNAGTAITLDHRLPENVCSAIEKYQTQVLPTSPTFLNMLILSRVYTKYDLSSLELVTYGSEPMPESTLKQFHALFPKIQLQQTYGLSELGILRSKSKASDSLWIKVGGEGFQTRVLDGLLEIKAESSMLGYLNAQSPFTDDGWFKTGDAVEVDGEFIRFCGRMSEVINIGGEKVFPAEIENVLLQIPGVLEASVSGESHALMGQIVKASIKLATAESVLEFTKRLRIFCRDRLSRYKIPQKILLTQGTMHNERFKKIKI